MMAKPINEIEKKLKHVENLLSNANMASVTMSELAWESYQERWHKKDKRYCWIIGVLIAVLFMSNMGWLWLWNQYDYATIDVTTDGGGNAYYEQEIGGNMNNGED